ncbi:unnamed protein product [Amaranthus hypochondriacus]
MSNQALQEHQQPQVVPNRWFPLNPDDEWIKINFDAHVANTGERGLGIVDRDANGQLLLAEVWCMQATWSPELSELNAVVYGVEVALRMGYSRIVLEGDCATVIHGIQHNHTGFTPHYALHDAIAKHKVSFAIFTCNFVCRNCNIVAHLVARWNSGRIGETIFMYPFLQSLVTLASFDLI